jgi:dihydrofolate reductase
MAMTTRRLYVNIITSLDGYIEGPNRELDWFQEDNAQWNLYTDEMLDSVGIGIFGRRAYQLLEQYWTNAEVTPRSPRELAFAHKLKALPKLVLSRTLQQVTWSNTRVARDIEEIAVLKRQSGKPIVAWAGAELVASLMQADLVDEYRLVVHPVVLGAGTALFRNSHRMTLRQVRNQSLDGGLSVLSYEPTSTS